MQHSGDRERSIDKAGMVPGAARIVTVGNLKGGTGKSTLSVNLACAVAAEGRSCAIIDTDPQGTVMRWAARGELPVACWAKPLKALDQVGDWLGAVTELRGRYDLLVIDLPAVARPAFVAASFIADLVLVPVAPLAADIAGTSRALADLAAVRRARAAAPPAVLLVPSRVGSGNGALELPPGELAALVAEVGGAEVGPGLRADPEHDRAFRQGSWVGSLAPDSAAHREVMALAAAMHAVLRRTALASPTLAGDAGTLASERRTVDDAELLPPMIPARPQAPSLLRERRRRRTSWLRLVTGRW
jgi:chromosome partitioning protein